MIRPQKSENEPNLATITLLLSGNGELRASALSLHSPGRLRLAAGRYFLVFNLCDRKPSFFSSLPLLLSFSSLSRSVSISMALKLAIESTMGLSRRFSESDRGQPHHRIQGLLGAFNPSCCKQRQNSYCDKFN
jgi:hypothetical protein